MESSKELLGKEKISTYLYVGSLYFFAVSVLYLWGYWGPFDVNILEYLNLTDVLKLAAYPIASAFFAIVGGMVLNQYLAEKSPPRVARPESYIGRFIRRHPTSFALLYISGAFALSFFGSVEIKWRLLPFLVAYPIFTAAFKRNLLVSMVPHHGARAIILALLAFLPPGAFGEGQIRAAAIRDGSEYSYLAADTIEDLKIGDANDPAQRIKHLGQVADYVFLLTSDNSTLIIVRNDRIKGIHLRHFKKYGVPPGERSDTKPPPSAKPDGPQREDPS